MLFPLKSLNISWHFVFVKRKKNKKLFRGPPKTLVSAAASFFPQKMRLLSDFRRKMLAKKNFFSLFYVCLKNRSPLNNFIGFSCSYFVGSLKKRKFGQICLELHHKARLISLLSSNITRCGCVFFLIV